MSTLQEQIQADFQKARKNKETEEALILSVVLGELDRQEQKVLSDENVVKLIKKISEDAEVTGQHNEVKILKKYLPELLTKERLIDIITVIISDNKLEGMRGLGVVMKTLKEQFINRYDGKMASQIAKELLA
jgi:uncharacterized protein YqeY